MHSHAALERFQANRYYQIDRLGVPERFLGILRSPTNRRGHQRSPTNERNKNVERDKTWSAVEEGGTKRAAGNQRDPRTGIRVRFRGKMIARKRGMI